MYNAYGNSAQFLLNLELRQAADKGRDTEVRKLIEAGAQVGDGDGAALVAAAYWGHQKTVLALIEAGPEPVIIRSALRSAERNEQHQTAEMLRAALEK